MDIDDLRSLYLSDLQQLCDCEAQMIGVLPNIAISTGSAELRKAIRQQLEVTVLHQQQLAAILQRNRVSPSSGADQVMLALVQRAERIVEKLPDRDLRDAALVAMLRRIGHNQIAAYHAVEGYAKALCLEFDRHILLACLREEEVADSMLAAFQIEANELALLVSVSFY